MEIWYRLIPVLVAIFGAPITTLIAILIKWFWENPKIEYILLEKNKENGKFLFNGFEFNRRVRLKELFYCGEMISKDPKNKENYIRIKYGENTLLIQTKKFSNLPKRVKILIGKTFN